MAIFALPPNIPLATPAPLETHLLEEDPHKPSPQRTLGQNKEHAKVSSIVTVQEASSPSDEELPSPHLGRNTQPPFPDEVLPPRHHRTEAEIEASLDRIPGHHSHYPIMESGSVNSSSSSNSTSSANGCAPHLHSPERLRQLRQQQDDNLAEMKRDLFKYDDELAVALEEIRKRKQWMEWGVSLE